MSKTRRKPRREPPSSARSLAQRLASLDPIFRPRSVAVVGASRRRHQIGHEIVRALVKGDFTGPVYPVNPTATVVHSMHCYPKVSAIPGDVDLAIIVVPAPLAKDAVRDCGEKGVRGIVCITAGFSEIGGEGVQRQAELLAVCEKYGMRLIGPNCMGVLNTDEEFSMNASFAEAPPTPGEAAFLSQSGALGAIILADAKTLGLGVSMFASVGNRADVSPPDLLEYWEADPRTKQILMYLEAFGEPERFMSTARRVSRHKPILVVKSGRTARGAAAAISHTGSLAGSEVAVDSLLNQCGVLRVDSMKDLFALANAGVPLRGDAVFHPVALAIMVGLLIGKPLGIVGFSWIAIRLRIAQKPAEFGWGALVGGGFLAGIGFTMALFIAELALSEELLYNAKMGILTASAIAAVVGMLMLTRLLPNRASG
jgi:acyl-CoA synthetase (NDP forming)